MPHIPLEFRCICGNCRHWNCDEDYCMGSGKHEIYEEDTCEYWEDENVLTKEDEDAIIGDREAHRIMVEGVDDEL